ncbi:MAG: hypothetical protein ED556_03225 [Winogradskyella sp.]|uniref:hypothetical protein n=1 Tax=Winogradskyella sp. TaxID=1883156 RepID=UPI000F3D5E8A|nr:hypothetical protein [Winogradskyella sp.]RNC88209.1 MAG: hypothetical protein ED556_03225 [Winogradskyella sp.]
MRKTIKHIIAAVLVLTIIACSSSDGAPANSAPTEVTEVVFPTANLLCTDNNITFQWNASTDADNDPVSYRIIIATDRDLTNVVEERTVNTNSVTIILQQGVAYYWSITAIDDMGNESNPSTTLAFFTSGPGISNYAPFTAALNAPADGGSISAGSVNLSWTGADTDVGDVLTYDLFFGTSDNPPLIEAGLSAQIFNVNTTSGTTYYWKVDTTDDSGVKTLGQIWSFSTN